MSKQLNVDPVDLHMSSDHLDMHHAELTEAHAAADADIEAAQSGWVGSSAAALQAKFGEWQGTTTRLQGDIASHSETIRRAAEGYTATDADSGQSLDKHL